MKLCVLVPSREYASQAGVRIRYQRIEHVLRDRGHELHILPVPNLVTETEFEHDAYIISKCHDASAFLVTRHLAGSGKPVGVDLFDDYFSQSRDSRFTGLRYWLRTVLESADFALCSTMAMREIAAGYAPDVAAHVMNDPAVPLDAEDVRAAALRKLEHARRSGKLQLGWFGIGDNPHFSVGLTDLADYGAVLARLQGRGFDVRLSILTNLRAMTPDGLAMLRRLPLPFTVEEWTEERERRLLSSSLACFLPVNAQSFSVAKSLNRAVSALGAGSQVLSAGYPLYGPLAPFIYRDPGRLLEDLASGSLALREETVAQFMRLLEQRADPVAEATALVAFLEQRRASQPASPPQAAAAQAPAAALIHGTKTSGDVHKLAQRTGVLSVSSPFCSDKLNFDLRFAFAADGHGFDVLVAEKRCAALARESRALLAAHGKVLDTTYRKLSASQLMPGIRFDGAALARMASPMSIAACYPRVMANIETTLRHLFPGIRCYVSEQAALPWSVLPRTETLSAN